MSEMREYYEQIRAAFGPNVYNDFLFYARRTATKLFELGLIDGQQWLLDQPHDAPKRARRKKVSA